LFQIDPSWYQVDWWLIAIVAICIIAFFALVINRGIRAHRRQASAGREDLIGKIAEVRIALEPKGIVFIQGERWTAISETGRVEPEEEVIITKVDGLKLYVTKK
jgi:membrane-bound ClpP family serine protease